MELAIDTQNLKMIIKEAVREAIKEEKIDFFLNSIPFVSNEEMEDIEKIYGEPEKRETAFSEVIEI